MNKFELISPYQPTGDQPQAIAELVAGIEEGKKIQVLLGATGTGKTFTISNVIATVNKPTLVLVHNKTLAGQLYNEFKQFFPNNKVEYFVSNFDFYQPEAYMPSTDTYIDKEAVRNDDIEMMRASSINSVLSRNDTIVVASVAAIYALNDPEEYRNLVFMYKVGEKINRKEFIAKLIDTQYQRNDIDLQPGTFRVRGDVIEIAPPDLKDKIIRFEMFDDLIEAISEIDPLTGKTHKKLKSHIVYPAYSHASAYEKILEAIETIKEELKDRLEYFRKENKLLEFQRLEQRTNFDCEALREFGICAGIENYSRHIDKRQEGETPYSLFDYFPKDFLLVVDESHVSLPQIRGMYNGDRARKQNLVDYGFRLPSALDNRPLNYTEFENKVNQMICVSATPAQYELERVDKVVEQVIRPTGLLDPLITVMPSLNQIDDIIYRLNEQVKKKERTLITTLTIKMAEDLTDHLRNRGFKVAYLHNETKTLERVKLIYELRKGKYDILVGINLLREGLDLPEVSLILILDADKEGFLRSASSLIQIIGRAARNVAGHVIMYANNTTASMEKAIAETNRRRQIQIKFNEEHHITPTTIIKKLEQPPLYDENVTGKKGKAQREYSLKELERMMKQASRDLDFERAAELRDLLFELKERGN